MENFDLAGALKEGYSQQEIAQYLAQQKSFDYTSASKEGYSDAEIISHLLEASPSDAFKAQAEYSGASSLLGIAQLAQKLGFKGLDEARMKAQREAADILSTGNRASSIAGTITGALLDPIGVPGRLMKGVSLTKQGLVQGGTAGFLEPVLSETDSRVSNTVVGTIAGGAIGSGLGYIARKLAPEQAAKAADVVSPEAAAKESTDLVQASEDAIASVARTGETNYNIPAWQRAGYNLDEAIVKEDQARLAARMEQEQRVADAKIEELQTRATQLEEQKKALPAESKQQYYVSPEGRVEQKAVHDYMVGQQSRAIDVEISHINKQIEDIRAAKEAAMPAAPAVNQVAARDARLAAAEQRMVQRGELPPRQPEAPVAAPARIAPEGPPRSALNLGFGADSISAARTSPELMLAHEVPFNTNVAKVFDEKYKGRANIADVSDDAFDNDVMAKVVSAVGPKGRSLRGRGAMGGTLEATAALGAKQQRAMSEAEGSVAEWVLNNSHKSWNREEVAAVIPEFIKSREFVMNTIDEYNALRAAGKLTPEMEDMIMHRSQLHLGIMSIFQGQRTRASDTLNAFKLAKQQYREGKTVSGFASPKNPC